VQCSRFVSQRDGITTTWCSAIARITPGQVGLFAQRDPRIAVRESFAELAHRAATPVLSACRGPAA